MPQASGKEAGGSEAAAALAAAVPLDVRAVELTSVLGALSRLEVWNTD